MGILIVTSSNRRFPKLELNFKPFQCHSCDIQKLNLYLFTNVTFVTLDPPPQFPKTKRYIIIFLTQTGAKQLSFTWSTVMPLFYLLLQGPQCIWNSSSTISYSEPKFACLSFIQIELLNIFDSDISLVLSHLQQLLSERVLNLLSSASVIQSRDTKYTFVTNI